MTSLEPLKEGGVRMGAQHAMGSGPWTLTYLVLCSGCYQKLCFQVVLGLFKALICVELGVGLWAFLFCSRPETPRLIGQH